MGVIGLGLMAGTLVMSAVVFGWVTVLAHPRAAQVAPRSRDQQHDDLVRLACRDLDDEYRQLLRH